MNEDTMTNWYLLGLGSEVDIHTVHYHAESFLFKVSARRPLGGQGREQQTPLRSVSYVCPCAV